MCTTNRALGSENQELHNLKNKEEDKVQQREAVVVEKEVKLKSVATELDRTQQTLCSIIGQAGWTTSGKSLGDHSSVGYKG